MISIGSFSYYKLKDSKEWRDRLNPFLNKTIGYAILPEEVTYNGGDKYDPNGFGNKVQIPDKYHVLVVDSNHSKEQNYLTFSGGQSPEGKNFGKVIHKGTYVYKLEFVSWEDIPKKEQKILLDKSGR
ncbi:MULTISPECIES: hypothetical protein [Vagococcus]|uniref:hypothetical protein n=1 Tax=Vagococcus TaxID=2737 RepID=UPI001F38D064|nr:MULTISPECIES: hypothetical protein [Vagococcus]